MGRFISSDVVTSTGQGLLGNNMFAYCANSPVSHDDSSGNAVDTVFDVLSLAGSIAEVADDPSDKWAWAGLAGDVVDVLLPLVGGVGETIRVAKTAMKVADAADDLHDASRIIDKATDSKKLANTMLGGACFVAGTLVYTENGNKPIEQVQINDLVWAWDEHSGEVALKPVVETYVNQSSELIHLFVNGEEIICTPTHPFYSPVKGWTEAVHLRAGDILVLVNGEYVVIEKVQHEILKAPVTVYNFQVEDYHTYYVADVGVLVHNKCSAGFKDIYNISTGRNQPNNLIEQLAMESAMSNPTAGKMIIARLKDPRLSGFQKYAQNFDTTIGKIEVHYLHDPYSDRFFDFKFK